MADNTTQSDTQPQFNPQDFLSALYAIFGSMQGPGSNLLQFQSNNPWAQGAGFIPGANGQLIQRPNFVVGGLPGAQMVAPGGGNVHFTGGSPFEVNPLPAQIGNALAAVGRLVEAYQTRKVNNAAKAKAAGASSGG